MNKFPNGFFGNGPGRDDPNSRDQDAYLRNKMQMTVATSTFAGVALVGMFCSCIWFACCRNSSSKTRKKARTWATANPEAGLQNPYSYDGYMDAQGYVQMDNNNEGGVAPYMSNPLYASSCPSMYGDNGLTSAYDFNDHFGFNQGAKAPMSTLFGGSATATLPVTGIPVTNGQPKDVPPSYTALFFAASDAATGIGGKATGGAAAAGESQPSTDPRVTNIQPIHLKVTSSAQQRKASGCSEEAIKTSGKNPEKYDKDDDYDDMENYISKRDQFAAPVSLLSLDSDPGKGTKDDDAGKGNKGDEKNDKKKSIPEESHENPPPYNPGYNSKGYLKF